MRIRFNDDLLLWAIATLQPASVKDAVAFIGEIFPSVNPLPEARDLEPLISGWQAAGYLVRVHGKSRLFSVTRKGNEKLSVRLRRHRDKARLFLLKAAHGAKFMQSGATQRGMAGASPAVNCSGSIQEGSQPINPAASPRRPRPACRTYWPRVVKQLDFKVGSELRTPDIFFEYYSFPTARAIHAASGSVMPVNDLDLSDLGIALGISPRLLTAFIHKPAHHYRQFEIGKSGGGARVISSPRTFLKIVQYWLLDYFLFGLPVHANCHAYRPQHSIVSNAMPHVNKPFVGNIDIENFFGSISQDMVQDHLRVHGIGAQLANAISRLLTLENALPQGAPTSPLISNSILYDFDAAMTERAASLGAAYTRYADDMTLSGDDRKAIISLIDQATALLARKGLRLNSKKTRVASRGGQQKVTGVVVNEKLQPPRQLRRRIRAMFHQAAQHPLAFRDKLPQLRGYFSYLQSYPAIRDSRDLQQYKRTLDSLLAHSTR
ncbi:MAG TPA: retron St85 family RNA-directed DNA polymerase [Nitrosomonas halophila]|nr:retron St85 family RNA-directed DNA polymerase [Nitrosomonas halophila]